MVIKLTDAATYYKALPHQQRAFEYLQELLTERELQHFAKLYRGAPKVEPQVPAAPVAVMNGLRAEHPITRKVLNRILALGFKLEKGKAYIVGIEGVDTDLKPNKDLLDAWNDAAGALYVQHDGIVRLIGPFKCTTEPGRYYTVNPMNSKGGARVLLDSYNKDVWMRGTHIREPNCLIQTGAPITVSRDKDRDGKRDANEYLDRGWHGINAHSTGRDNWSPHTIGRWSAGCLCYLKVSDKNRVMAYLNRVARNQSKFTYILLDGSKL